MGKGERNALAETGVTEYIASPLILTHRLETTAPGRINFGWVI